MQRCMGCMREFGEEFDVCPYCGYVVGTDVASKNHLAPGTVLQDRYTLGRVLGQGGFGITYIAWDNKIGREVAIKEYMPNAFASRITGEKEVSCFNEEAQRQFDLGLEKTRKEAHALSQFGALESVVKVYDCVEENKTAYIVMELLRGKTAKEILAERGKLTFSETMRIMTPVLQTLDAMHQVGMIHRDVAPDNIFVCEDGKIKLLDFGAARVVSSTDDKTLSVMLKAGYAPVEQYSSRGKQGAYTDVYAVSATIFKMLTGITPPDSLSRALNDDDLSAALSRADAPHSAQKTILHGIAQNANERIQSARQLLSELQKELAENIDGIDPTRFLKAYRSRKGKMIATAVAAIIAITIVGAVLTHQNKATPPSSSKVESQHIKKESQISTLPTITESILSNAGISEADIITADGLRSKVENEMDYSVQSFICQDFNHDGILEAFALTGNQVQDHDGEFYYESGNLVFVSSHGIVKLLDFQEPYVSATEFTLNAENTLRGCSIFRHSGGSGGFLSLFTVDKKGNAIEIATNSSMQSTPTIGKHQWLEINCSAFDASTDGTGHTWKPYFYYYDEKKNALIEYGGVEISKDDLFKIKNAKTSIQQALLTEYLTENDAYEICSVFYRGNNIINVNLTINSSNETIRSNKYINLFINNGVAEVYTSDSSIYSEVGEGRYLKSSSPQNVDYSEFPY